ncbi:MULTISPECIES: vanadium-dependent haloperoxidase [Streptomyces]|uniref:vanadium-dependent haloperoxidase n=1 Tax=Streptomyces TaxID=1883 RepID=UPI0020CFA65A|nr:MULTISPECIES: vanadium-dependent haloperoxidase [Streptomyces]MCP9960008.1 vanadium-dependent haloperoxidase [Streptomyces sudanensis]MCP9999588.1 vanadium-dependent haloperoxidase [Streptomyces sudanensis]
MQRTPKRPSPRRVVAAAAALLGLTAMAATVPAPAAEASQNLPAPSGSVVADWARLTADIVDPGGRLTPPEEAVWHAFVSAGMYNAVVGIEGRYEPYRWNARGPRTASSAAAAASAAHDVLLHYFPKAKNRLKAAYDASLAAVPDGPAEKAGVAFGRRAAARVVALREDDGRGAPVALPASSPPGAWRPTPPGNRPFASVWLARMRPLLMDRPDRFRPGPPPALTSLRYAADLNEVKAYGAKNSTVRSQAQTDTALFFTKLDLQGALADRAARNGLDLVDTARLFAAVNTVQADAVIAAWDAKLHYNTWRPVTAIREADRDGNPLTQADPAWVPFLDTPPHPDYLSGHTTTAGALTRTLTLLSGDRHLDLRITSLIAKKTRYYDSARAYNRDCVGARTWAGIHTRTANTVGTRTGERVASWALARHFRPVGD